MFRSQSRWVHYTVLAVAHFLLTLPNLGGHTFWDMDEGVNAEAAREMLESGNWTTPYFNYELRTAKPALLYWLQATSYQLFGVNEFAARLPAVLCGLGSLLFTYELARRMFSPTTGLLAGLVLASCIEFCLISHAATPDPPLLFFLLGAFYCYWAGSEGDRRWWFVPCAIFCALAVLTKGPVGVALPGLVIVLHLAWMRQLHKLWDGRFVLAGVVFILVAGPWYGMVSLDTKGKWLEAFLTNENIKRFSEPSEGHGGPIFYHAAMLFVLSAPWCVFLLPSLWTAARETSSKSEHTNAYRFLTVWFLAYLVFFSIAATKLPNYVLPLYPAVAILIARWLDRWREGSLAVRPWLITLAAIGGVIVGLTVLTGLMLMSGMIPLPKSDPNFRPLPALGVYAWLGLIPLIAGLLFGWFGRMGRRDTALVAYAAGAVAFLGALGGGATAAMDEYKVPKYAAVEVGLRQTDREIRIGAFGWFRESLVFYCRREVTRLPDIPSVEQFLSLPRPAYLLMPDDFWNVLSPQLGDKCKEIGRRFDFYTRRDIVIVANRAAAP
jgi:4-amino-4-deoxy-L-arabinose transferase-like glycosyltransferase